MLSIKYLYIGPMKEIDSDWFRTKIKESSYRSIRGLARAIEERRDERFDHSYLVRILNGERRMQLNDLEDLCILLNLNLKEVLKRAGFEV